MKQRHFIAVILCFFYIAGSIASAQDVDTEISKLTEDLAAKISNKQCKKVSVTDFTDLESNPTELGKYIADQMTVDFAMNNRDFSVLDRAHLKKIMDEHQLTASGLVDPDKAKQLGMLAGVDALIFGKVTQIGDKVSVTVEVIATDSGSVFTAGKTKFTADDSVRQLGSKSSDVTPSTHPTVATQPIPDLPNQTNGNLAVAMTSLRSLKDHYNSYWYQVDLSFQNISTDTSIAVAMLSDQCIGEPCPLQSTLISGDGIEYSANDKGLLGIHPIRQNPLNLTLIRPGEQLRVSIKFKKSQDPSPTITKFSLRSTIVVNQSYSPEAYNNYRIQDNNLPPNCQTITFFMDYPIRIIPRNNFLPQINFIPHNSYVPQNNYAPQNNYVPQNNPAPPKYYR